ncbi:MAG TPA: CARDB domain-containing protein, partial [Candidatus Thermoplasmatota archaeon]|nr:CARDB domain-containing protein [Candidatus Thermoplasmatota archaeon]
NFGGGTVPPVAAWYPSRDGGVAGTDFLVRALSDNSDGNGRFTGIYMVSPDATAFVSVGGGGFTGPGSGGGAGVQGAQPVDDNSHPGATRLLHVSSSRPILLMNVGETVHPTIDRFGLQLVTPDGGPVGAHLVGYLRRDITLVNGATNDTKILLGSPLGDPDSLLRVENEPLPAGAHNAYHTSGCSCATPDLWRFDAKDEFPLWGKAGESGLVPIGGQHGQEFKVSLHKASQGDTDTGRSQLVIIGLYNGTRVTVTNSSDARVVLNTTIGLHGWLFKERPPPVGQGDWNITASKPVLAYLWGPPGIGGGEPTYGTYFSSRAEPPIQALGSAEFHGFAVGWLEKVKTTAVAPGERVRLKLTVLNLGRGIGGRSITDDIGLSQEVTGPPNATLPDVDLSSVLIAGLPSFQGRDLTLSVEVPADAATGTVYQINITATSRGNPNFSDVMRVVVTVQIRYEFTLRFAETNSTAIQKIIRPDTATCIDLEARNTGTGDVTLRFQMSPTAKSPAAVGFDPRLLPLVQGLCDPGSLAPLVDADGQPTQAVVLKRGELRTLTLYVRAPADTRPLPLEVEIQATAGEDASVRQQVSATVFTNVEAKLKVTALNDTSFVVPSGNASFQLRVENVGDVETPIEYGTTGLLPLGWNVSFEGAPPLLRGRGSVDATGTALDTAEFTVNITAASDAPVGLVVPVNIVATSAIIIDTGETSRAFRQSDSVKVTALVANNFTLEQPEPAPVTINPGEPFLLAYELVNAANGNFTLRIAPAGLPRNWTLNVSEPAGDVQLGVGQRLQVRIEVTPELATKAGPYEVGVAFVARDAFTQGAQFRNTSVLVRSTSDFRVEPEVESVLMAPGGERELSLKVTNSGNLPIALRLTALPPAGYQVTFPQQQRADLEPGNATILPILLRAPEQAAELSQAVRIVALDENSNKQKEFTFEAQTARLDLVAVEVAIATKNLVVGQPAVATASLQNTGTVPANNVAVVLLVNGRGVRNDTIRTLPPGEPRAISLPWTVDEPVREVVVIVDADNKYAESDESNNQARVEVSKSLPLPAMPLLLLALGALALAHARRRRGHG